MSLGIIPVCYHRKRLDGTLQDLEDQQNSKRETVCSVIYHSVFTFAVLIILPDEWMNDTYGVVSLDLYLSRVPYMMKHPANH